MSFMGGLLSGNAPLRGRASLDMTVHTLDYRLAAEFWGLRDPRLAFPVYAVAGGTPAYRTDMIRYDAPRDQADFDDWVVRAILSPGSPVFMEARYLLAEEPDLRDPALYHSVLAAIAEGNTMRGAIANTSDRNQRPWAPAKCPGGRRADPPRERRLRREPQPFPDQRAPAQLLSRDDAAVLAAADAGDRNGPDLETGTRAVLHEHPRPPLRGTVP